MLGAFSVILSLSKDPRPDTCGFTETEVYTRWILRRAAARNDKLNKYFMRAPGKA